MSRLFVALAIVAACSHARAETADPWADRDDVFVAKAAPLSTKVELGTISRTTLSNGLVVLTLYRPGAKMVDVELAVRAGRNDDVPGRSGIAAVTSFMMKSGTTHRSRVELAHAVEQAGGYLDAHIDEPASFVSCDGRRHMLELCVDLISDAVLHPSFPEEELSTERATLANGIEVGRGNQGSLARLKVRELYFGADDPRGHIPTHDEVEHIDRAALIAFYDRFYHPGNSVLAIAGDFDAKALHEMIVARFGGWKRRTTTPPALPTPHAKPLTLRVVDMPDVEQTQIRAVGPGIARGDRALCALTVASEVLGGPNFTSRLMTALRSKSGKTYAVNTMLPSSRTYGLFGAGTFTRNAEAANIVKLLLAEVARMKASGPTDEELAAAKATLVGHFGLDVETGADALHTLVGAEIDGLPPTFVPALPACYANVTRAEVAAAAAAHFDLQALVLVGPAKTIVPLLRAADLAPTDVVPAK